MKIERVRELGPGATSPSASVAAVGNFDGVHLGHQRALAIARSEATAHDAEFVAVTFDPHPARLLRPESAPQSITTPLQKAEQLTTLGVQRLVVVEFNEAVAELAPAAFVERLLVGRLGVRAVVQGANFRFGRDRSGDLDALRTLGGQHGFGVIEAPAVEWGGEVVSSTRIRLALADRDLDFATAMLGRPYEVSGEVIPGRGRGRGLGFPTANLEADGDVLLPHGVYAAEAVFASSSESFPSVVHFGPRPTFDDAPSLEAHLIGFAGSLDSLRLRFTRFLREIEAFESAEALRDQLERDVVRAALPEEGAVEPEPVLAN